MATHITRVRASAGGGSAYANYALAGTERAPERTVDTLSAELRGSADTYAGYVLIGEGSARWLGRQAEAWGLAGPPSAEALATILEHFDPITGRDLDADRVRRTESWLGRQEAAYRDHQRWAEHPQLVERAAGYALLIEWLAAAERTGGDAPGAAAVDTKVTELLEGLLPDRQLQDLRGDLAAAVVAGRKLSAAARGRQGRQRLVPPVAARDYVAWRERVARFEADPDRVAHAATFEVLAERAADGRGALEAAVEDAAATGSLPPATLRALRSEVAAAAPEADLVALVRARAVASRMARPTAPQPPKAPSRDVIGYDVTFSASKTVSLLLCADENTRALVLAAHQRAVGSTMRLLEAELSAAGVGRGRQGGRVDIVGIAGVGATHMTSRPVEVDGQLLTDPQLHEHVVVSALAQTVDGRWVGIDSRAWFRAVSLLDAHYQASLRSELTADLGLSFVERELLDRTTGQATGRTSWEVDFGFSPQELHDVIASFSNRDAEVGDELARRRAAGLPANKQAASFVTRNNKEELSLAAALPSWQSRLAAGGIDMGERIADAVDRADERTRDEARAADQTAQTIRDLNRVAATDGDLVQQTRATTAWISSIADRLAAESGMFGRQDLARAVFDAAPPSLSGDEVMATVDAYLDWSCEMVSSFDASHAAGWVEARWTTTEHWQREEALIAAARRLLFDEAATATLTAEQAGQVLSDFEARRDFPLAGEQRELFLAAMRLDGSRMAAASGIAGAGKTTVASAIADGHRLGMGSDSAVVAVALANVAADNLAAELEAGGAEVHGSIDKLLKQIEHKPHLLTDKTLLIIDEAAMAADAKVTALLEAVDRAGARVVLFGDPQQLGGVQATSGLLSWLDDQNLTISLRESRRHQDAEVRGAQLEWHAGLEAREAGKKALDEVLDFYVDRGDVSVAHGAGRARDLAFTEWVVAHRAGADRRVQWESDLGAAEQAYAEARKRSDWQAAQAAGEEAKALRADRSARVRDEQLLLAYKQADAAVLSDRIQEYLADVGVVDRSEWVEGRRWANAEWDVDGRFVRGDEMRDTDGADLSRTKLMAGLEVRITKNSTSAEIRDRLATAKAAAAERSSAEAAERRASFVAKIAEVRDAKAKREDVREAGRWYNARLADFDARQRPWQDRWAFADKEVRRLSEELKGTYRSNGQRGTVTALDIRTGSVTVELREADGSTRPVAFSAEELATGMVVPAAGGAMTIHASQGQTVDEVMVLADRESAGLDSHLLYVAMTRSRYEQSLIYAADLDLVDPRVQQWENDRRDAERNGRPFTRPEPTEELDGLWQLREVFATAGAEELAHQVRGRDALVGDELTQSEWNYAADRARARGYGEEFVVSPAFRDYAREIVDLRRAQEARESARRAARMEQVLDAELDGGRALERDQTR